MAFLIDPDHFGCSSKLGYGETASFGQLMPASSVRFADSSFFDGSSPLVLSIDRVARCATDWVIFAHIALNHVVADVTVAGGFPECLLIAYEFGPDAISPQDRTEAVAAFIKAAQMRGLDIGKCHSTAGHGPTAVTIAVVGSKHGNEGPSPSRGSLLIDRPVGNFKLHYMAEMGLTSGLNTVTADLARIRKPNNITQWAALTDISGHGLLGAALSIARRHDLDLVIEASRSMAASPLVLDTPIACLENPRMSYEGELLTVDEDAWPLVTLRETAGPLLGLMEGHALPADPFKTNTSRVIGYYAPGTGRVSISWQK